VDIFSRSDDSKRFRENAKIYLAKIYPIKVVFIDYSTAANDHFIQAYITQYSLGIRQKSQKATVPLVYLLMMSFNIAHRSNT